MQVQIEILNLGKLFLFLFFWQSLLKTEVTFQECSKRRENGKGGWGEKGEKLKGVSTSAKLIW